MTSCTLELGNGQGSAGLFSKLQGSAIFWSLTIGACVTESQNKRLGVSSYSERVAGLAAACLQTIVRKRLSIVLPFQQARELAQIYGEIGRAVDAIEQAQQVHQQSGLSKHVDQLVIAEASIGSGFAREHVVEAVVEIRREANRNREIGSRAVEEARRIDLKRAATEREFRDWGETFGHFLDALDSLFKKTERRIRILGLAPDDSARAIEEVENILLRAIKKALPGS